MSFFESVRACIQRNDDLRSSGSHLAFRTLLAGPAPIVSVGGGPTRPHSLVKNLNILVCPGVDVGGNAYQLPFRDNSVPGLHCEAVLEHLEYPDLAVREMYRVAAPQALILAVTPFLQPYHAYPDHFQNFTLNGHVRLLERAGFEIIEAAAAVGQTFMMLDMAANYAREYLPGRLLSRLVERSVRAVGRPFRLLDLMIRERPSAATLASTTYVLARKSR
jgi:hypothetical protein